MWNNDNYFGDQGPDAPSDQVKKKSSDDEAKEDGGAGKDKPAEEAEQVIPPEAVTSTPAVSLRPGADFLTAMDSTLPEGSIPEGLGVGSDNAPGSSSTQGKLGSGQAVKEEKCYMDQEMWDDLEKDLCFHGAIPIEDVISMLKKEGEFLVRRIDDDTGCATPVLTLVWDNHLMSYSLFTKKEEGKYLYSVDGKEFKETPRQLIRYHLTSAVPLFPMTTNFTLLHPISKQDWELSKENLTLEKKIGEGAFGEVWSGTLNRNEKIIPVAIKLMNMTANTKANLGKMHEEARIHRQYNHGNLVRLFGVVFTDADVRIVMEIVDGGSLEKYLKNNKVGNLQKASYSYDIAAGLTYLHAKKFMHRDIAARNCLIGDNGKLAKLSDFGLSVKGVKFEIPKNEKIPVRWQAPEVLLEKLYLMASDVWSYGMLLWEIHNDGAPPFTGKDNKEIRQKIVNPTFRPPVSFTTQQTEIYYVIRSCWQQDPKKRPPMKAFEKALKKYCVHPIIHVTQENVMNARPSNMAQSPAPRSANVKTARKAESKCGSTKKKSKNSSMSPNTKSKKSEMKTERKKNSNNAPSTNKKVKEEEMDDWTDLNEAKSKTPKKKNASKAMNPDKKKKSVSKKSKK